MSAGAVGLSGPGAVVLTGADVPSELLEQLAAAVRSPEPAAALASVLFRVGDRLPALAAYARDGGGVRLFARGTGSSSAVDRGGGRHALDPAAGSALADLLVADAVEVTLSGGLALAGRWVHRLAADPIAEASVVAATPPAPRLEPVVELPAFDPPVLDAPPPAPAALDELPDPISTQIFAEGDLPVRAAAGDGWSPPSFDGTMTGEYDFAQLIDGEPGGAVEAAAVRPEVEAGPSDDDLVAFPAWDPPASAPVPGAGPGPTSPEPAAAGSGWSPPALLGGDATPAVGVDRSLLGPAPAAPGAPTAVPPFRVGPPGPLQDDPASGPKVQAVSCPAGHLNHPAAPVCRVCGSAIIDRSVTWANRPSLGRLRFDDGMSVELDRSLVIGRRPSPGVRGGEYGLVTVADPESSISRSHAELVLEDWQVAIVDLGSTNGTVVQVPGEEPVRLRADDPYLVGPGVRVVLGGVTGFEITGPTG